MLHFPGLDDVREMELLEVPSYPPGTDKGWADFTKESHGTSKIMGLSAISCVQCSL